MKAVEVSAAGGPDVLRVVERPRPQPGPREVLIRVCAVGVNGHDLVHRRLGKHAIAPGETDLPGLEVAGQVVECGIGVSRWACGERVCALLRGGGYAEFAVAHESLCLPVPSGLSDAEAACLPEACFTTWSNAFVEAALGPDESVLITGGSSGVGTTAIALLSALGFAVYAVASGAAKCDTCTALGATRTVDRTLEDPVAVIGSATSGRGVDVILDLVGGEGLTQALSMLAVDGRIAVIGTAGGANAHVDLSKLMQKRLRIFGGTLRSRSIAYKADIAAALAHQVWPLYASRRIQPIIDSTFDLTRAADAHARMEDRRHAGKLVLLVD